MSQRDHIIYCGRTERKFGIRSGSRIIILETDYHAEPIELNVVAEAIDFGPTA